MQLAFASLKDCLTLLCNTVSDTPVVLGNKFNSMLKMALCIYTVFLNLPHRHVSILLQEILHMYIKLHQYFSTTKKVAQDRRVDHRMKINVRKLH